MERRGEVAVMPPETSAELITAEELERIVVPGKTTELVRGRLIVREPPGQYHGRVAAKLLFLLGKHVYDRDLGWLLADCGFRIESDPDTVRAPDAAFVSKERQPLIPKRGYAPLAPDLAAEVLSPNDRPGEVLSKVGDWLDKGTQIVWVIDPIRRQARVYRADGTQSIVGETDALDGENVLPGFSCRLADFLD